MIEQYGGGAPASMQQAAAERYAQIRLHQAVQSGLISPQTLASIPPGQFSAAWRLVSQSVSAPAQEAGWNDPGMWLRYGGMAQGQVRAPAGPSGANAPMMAPPQAVPSAPATMPMPTPAASPNPAVLAGASSLDQARNQIMSRWQRLWG